jgi:hypothetical protein
MYPWGSLLLCCLLHTAAIAGEIATANATFNIQDEWSLIGQPTQERFTLRSSKRGIEINVLVQSAPKISEKNVETATKRLLAEAVRNHERSAEHWNLTLADVETKVSRGEQDWAGEFIGRDSNGRRFHQLVLVRPGRIVAIYADSKNQPPEVLLSAIIELVRGIRE